MTPTNNNTIGIIGGMGPDASARLYSQMITMAREEFGARKNHDYPEIILHSIPVPDFISDTSEVETATFMLKSRIEKLSQLPLSCFGMACNTAHILLNKLQGESSKPFISIIDEVAKIATGNGYSKVGIIASPTTIYSQLYQSTLSQLGILSVLPPDSDIRNLGPIIDSIIAGEHKKTKIQLMKIADKLKTQGIDALILGCTEIPLVFPKNYSIPVLNSIDILARALLKMYYEKGENYEKS